MSLRRQLTLALVFFLVGVTVVITAFTVISNERAEKFTWSTMLNFEMDRIEDTTNVRQVTDTGNGIGGDVINRIVYYRADSSTGIPAPFANLRVGVHDDLNLNGRLFAALVRGEAQYRRVVAVDVSSVEAKEKALARQVLFTILVSMLSFATLALWGLRRLLHPLQQLSDDIARLTPRDSATRLAPIARGTSEITTITSAINAYVERNQRFLEREREFINTASHELRTPIAVLRNTLQLAQTDLANRVDVSHRIVRSAQVVQEMQELLDVLLVLARDPEKLAPAREEFNLNGLVQQVVEEHAHLLSSRELHLTVSGEDLVILAPPKIVEIALSNIVRNAIENSDRGTIHVNVAAPGVVTVTDPGHGMTAQEISALYAQAARGHGGDRQLGIGLQLLARICSHLDWSLEFTESADGQTQARLRFPTIKKLG